MIDFGAGVSLGPLDQSQMAMIRAWRNDWATWRWCRQNDVISDLDQASWYSRQAADPSIRMYMIHENEHQRPVGVAGLTSIDMTNRRAEFSLYVAKKWHRGGFGKKALETLLAHGFMNLGLNCIWGETFNGNPAMKLFLSLGFIQEGILREFYFREGRFIDCMRFSMLRKDWGDEAVPRTQKLCSPPLPQSA